MRNPTRTSENGEFQEMKHTSSYEIRQRTRISQGNQEKDEEQEQIVTNVKGCKITEKSSCREMAKEEEDKNFGRGKW